MSLDLYLDDCADSNLLAALLASDGHNVTRPRDAGLDGAEDEDHLAFAAANGLTLVTKNPADFRRLHEADSEHAGILAVYQDNDAGRDMSDPEIVNAVRNLEVAARNGGEPIPGRFHKLNDWQY